MGSVTSDTARARLASLVGSPLWDLSFAADMAMFSFGGRSVGPGRGGRTVEKGEHALHVQTDWRLVQRDRILVGSQDVSGDMRRFNEREPWSAPMEIVRSRRRVTAIGLEDAGFLTLSLETDLLLEVRPDFENGADPEDEHWRFFQPTREEDHLVCRASGLSLG